MLVNPNIPNAVAEQRDVQAAALAIGQQLIIVDVSGARQIEMAFATFVQRGAGALLVGPGAPLNSNRELLVALAARHALGRPGLGSMIARRIALCRAVRPHAKDSHLDRSCQSQPQREIDRVASSYRTARVRKWHLRQFAALQWVSEAEGRPSVAGKPSSRQPVTHNGHAL
ncbi:MAG: hypothetical protein WB822_22100 [Rhodoplanes sp.]